MTDFVLKEASLEHTRKATEHLVKEGGKCYKVYRGKTKYGARLSVMIGMDASPSWHQWHMSIACTQQITPNMLAGIIDRFWPSGIPYKVENRQSMGVYFTHLYEQFSGVLQ